MALAHIRATLHGLPFLLGQFPTANPLLEIIFPSLTLLDTSWENMQIAVSQSLIKRIQLT